MSSSDWRHHPTVEGLRRLGRMLRLWALGHFLDEAVRTLWRSRAWSAFAVAIIGLSLATVGAFLLLAENLRPLVAHMSSLEVSVFLADDAAPATIDAVRATLAGRPGVTAVRFVSKDEALGLFRGIDPALARVADDFGENPLPASLEVTLAETARDPAALAALAADIERLPGVSEVSRDLALAERLRTASRVTRVASVFLGGVLLLSALFTVSNVVKLTVYARRDEIALLGVVGATPGYVRGTFVTEGVIQGLLGALLGLSVLYAMYRIARAWLLDSGPALLAALGTTFLSLASILLVVAAGVALGIVGSLVPLRSLGRI